MRVRTTVGFLAVALMAAGAVVAAHTRDQPRAQTIRASGSSACAVGPDGGGFRLPSGSVPSGFHETAGGVVDNPGLEAAERPTVATTYQDPGDPERHVTVVEGASDVLESLVPLEPDRPAGTTAGSLAEFEPRSGRTRPVVAVAAPDGDGLWSRVVIGSDGSAAGLRSAAVAAEGSRAEFGGEVVASGDLNALLGVVPSKVVTYLRASDDARVVVQTVPGRRFPDAARYIAQHQQDVAIDGCEGVLLTFDGGVLLVAWDSPRGLVALSGPASLGAEQLLALARGAR